MLGPGTAAGTRKREQFEWKNSRGAEVSAFEGQSRGLKCVRVATGEVICVWVWTAVSTRKVGKFLWLLGDPSGGGEWVEEAELVILMTLLAVVEKIKRDQKK